MHKEILFAIVFGSLFGLIVAYGVWRANTTLNNPDTPDVEQNQNTPAATEQGSPAELTPGISEPAHKSVVTSSPIALSGASQANSFIILSTERGDYLVETDGDGLFAANAELSGGINLITVTKADGSELDRVIVVYSSEYAKLEQTSTASGTLSENATTYIGTVTDITENSFQLRSDEGEIRQVVVDPDATTFANIISATKSVEFADLAIGDFVASLGQTNDKALLVANRILITTPLPDNERVTTTGTVSSTTRASIEVDTGNETESVATGGSVIVQVYTQGEGTSRGRTADLEEGDNVIVISIIDEEDEYSPRTIFITSSPDEE